MFTFRTKLPTKPKTQKGQIDMLWEACFNHLPTRLKWVDTKVSFILGFTALILGLLGVLVYGVFAG